ncbi:BlaI/MecI/CopY family transcriptional regulator [Nocardia sp. NBC_01388]|uniref:BlaI/MecI/CopY family transcriptional regulator n=1 Tax=Nocardia sp. NBC_01388 TaxID=2903596 RepID=UPI00324CFA4C
MTDALDRAIAALGPLEGRIMRLVWTSCVANEFVVRDIAALVPELAYTTVMTTLRRLADKGLLHAEARIGRRAHSYRAAGKPADYLAAASRREASEVVARYGDAALAAFATQLGELTEEQRRRLGELG